jgi:hypothetical protein
MPVHVIPIEPSGINFVAADETGDHAANADPNREGRIQIAGFCLAHMQNIGPIDDNRGEEKRAEKPEIRVAEDSEEERLILSHQLDLLPEIGDEVRTELLFRCSRLDLVDTETCAESDAREHDQCIAGVDLVACETFRHRSSGDSSDNNRQESAELDDAISEGEALRWKKFRQ